MPHILAIDPGGERSGWCLVLREHARVRYRTSGVCDSTPKGITELIEQMGELLPGMDYDTLVMAVEVPEGMVFQPFRAPALLDTRETVGLLAMIAWQQGIPTIRKTANEVRKLLVGKASSPKKGLMDKLVEDAVKANVIGWPPESNPHTRDAGALAIVTNWQLASRRVA
jgi:Holliday junction resolvasome RuvABC endonuclease subunit